MQFYGDQNPYHTYRIAPSLSPVVRNLIIVNIAVFFLQFVILKFARFDIATILALRPDQLLRKFWVWQLVTYGFLHSPYLLLHIIFNLLFLYWFGRDVEARLQSKRFLLFYLTAVAFAGLVFCVVHYAHHRATGSHLDRVIGASGGIMAVMVAYAIYFPNRTVLFFFLFPMKVRTLVILMVGLDAYYAVMHIGGGVANLAHLGGAAYGFLFLRYGAGVEARLARLLHRVAEKPAQKGRDDKMLDHILEKVHRQGIHRLSRRERRFLKRESKKRRATRT